MLAGKIVCLFIAVMFTVVNLLKASNKEEVPTLNLMSSGITGFITLEWLL
jgi:uncharacterized membrane protein